MANTYLFTGVQSLTKVPSDSASAVFIPFSVDTSGIFSVFARLNCPSYDNDSYWIKLDDGEFELYNGLITSGWQWLKLNNYGLTPGDHMLTFAYRESGAKLDKICISNYSVTPTGMGGSANNCEEGTLTDRVYLGSKLSKPVY